MAQIPLHLIETFVVFSENQNLVKCSQALSQSQPTTSRQLENLQTYFKKSLFKSIGRQKRLTDYGIQICNYYKKNVFEMLELQKNMNALVPQDMTPRLTLAARPEILDLYISPLQFHNPIYLQSSYGEKIRQDMENSELDIAVLQENFESYNYFRKKLFSSNWCLVVPATWSKPLNTVQFDSLLDLPFASFNRNLPFVYPNALKKIPFSQFNLKFISDDWRLIADKVLQQTCWSIIPQEYVPKNKVMSLSMNDYFKEFHFYLYFRKDLMKNKDVQNIIKQLS